MREFGDILRICYRGTTEDGDVFDERTESDPLEVALGKRALPRGIDKALWEMEVGEERTLTLAPEDAFGAYNPEDVIGYPKGALEGADDLKPGDIIRVEGNKAGMPPAFPTVKSNDGFLIELDFNHPLAGKTVTYWIRLLEATSK